MLFVHDKGRMCNNILQYAHVYAWAREHRRASLSMRFAYKYPYFHIGDTRYHNIFFYLLGKYAAKLRLLPTVSFHNENVSVNRQEALLSSHRHLMVEGWYVRFYDLFLKHKDEICRLFAFHNDIEQKTLARLAPCRHTLKLGLHIRRGDYARWQGGKYLYTDEQFIRVVRRFIDLHSDRPVSLWICSNDSELDRVPYQTAFGIENVHFADGNAGQDLCLLSHCDYLIGAPSTFTLVASMYRDTPLYWMTDAETPLTEASFDRFDRLFRHIL